MLFFCEGTFPLALPFKNGQFVYQTARFDLEVQLCRKKNIKIFKKPLKSLDMGGGGYTTIRLVQSNSSIYFLHFVQKM